MKSVKTSIFALLIAALCVPHQAHSMNTKTWVMFGIAGLATTCLIGLEMYEVLSEKEENNNVESQHSLQQDNALRLSLFDDSYNPKESNITGIYSFKETFTAQEYAQEIKKLLEHEKQYLFCLDELLNIVREKELMQEVFTHTFVNENNEKQTLLELSKNTWAQETVADHYLNFLANTRYAHFIRKFLETN